MIETEQPTTSMEPMPQKRSLLPTYIFIALLAVLTVITGLNYFFKPFAQLKDQPVVMVEPSPTPEVMQYNYRNMVEKMTAGEKIAQLIAAPINLDEFDASMSAESSDSAQAVQQHDGYIEFLVSGTPQTLPKEESWGFITLFGSHVSFAQAAADIAKLKSADTDIPVSILVDHEGGTVQRLSGEGFTPLPSWQDACIQPSDIRDQVWRKSAKELKEVGVDIVLAPVLDIASNHPVLKTRVCSSDPETIAIAAGEYIDAMRSEGIGAVVKHFPGIGQTKKDLHVAADSVTVTQDDVELYKLILNTYPKTGVMVSHVGVENQDTKVPCSISESCVGQVHELFPSVLLFTDALNMKSVGADGSATSLNTIATKALEAGNTVLLFEPGVTEPQLRELVLQLTSKYEQSYEFREKINSAVELVLRYKMEGMQ